MEGEINNKIENNPGKYIVILGLIVVMALISGLWYGTNKKINQPRKAADKVVAGDYTIAAGQTVVLENGAKLQVSGNLDIQGELRCSGGPLRIYVQGKASLSGRLACDRGEELPAADSGEGITFVAGNFDFADTAEIETNANVQITDTLDKLMLSREDYNEAFEHVARDSGGEPRLGPFVFPGSDEPVPESGRLDGTGGKSGFSGLTDRVIRPARAAGMEIPLGGKMTVNTPPKGVKAVVVFNFPGASGININNFDLQGPAGRDGAGDESMSCDSRGEDGQDAMRLLIQAPSIRIGNFYLDLGSGGNGGSSETKADCAPGIARGGAGGRAGNFKIIGQESFDITGEFIIYPGQAGSGGSAMAYGRDGGSGEPGGDATAIGGDAENNRKAIRAAGTVNGAEFIKFDSIGAGSGGSAFARAGNGGAGDKCERGGAGGSAEAEGGDGGDAEIYLSGQGAGRTDQAEDIPGSGGFVQAYGGAGGAGGGCTADKAGGSGGHGGEAQAVPGQAGTSATATGQAGAIDDQTGGAGGNGGDGCPGGKGGAGGAGAPAGADGKDGNNICPAEPADGAEEGRAVPKLPPDMKPEEGEAVISVTPADLSFTHNIGTTQCPQPIGAVTVSNQGGGQADAWQLINTLPGWLNMPASGALPGEVPVSFSCRLGEYATQSLEAALDFQLLYDGVPTGESAAVRVTGQVNAE